MRSTLELGEDGPASTTAAGLARRFTAAHLAGVEMAIGQVNARVLGLVGQVRRSALLRQITVDIDSIDVEVYGPRKNGVDYNYQGQRCGRPHIAFWAELGVPLAADLLDGRQDPRSSVVGLLRRALAALPPQATRSTAHTGTGAGTQVAVRVDAGYFAGELALECLWQGGCSRSAPNASPRCGGNSH